MNVGTASGGDPPALPVRPGKQFFPSEAAFAPAWCEHEITAIRTWLLLVYGAVGGGVTLYSHEDMF